MEGLQQLEKTARLLYGRNWQSEIGRLTGYDARRVRHWHDGTRPIPDQVWAKLSEALAERKQAIDKALKSEPLKGIN